MQGHAAPQRAGKGHRFYLGMLYQLGTCLIATIQDRGINALRHIILLRRFQYGRTHQGIRTRMGRMCFHYNRAARCQCGSGITTGRGESQGEVAGGKDDYRTHGL